MKKLLLMVLFTLSSGVALAGCLPERVAPTPESSPTPEASASETSTSPSSTVSATTDEAMQYSLEELAKHNTASDCWIGIEGKVYNVTDFIGQHPGGQAILFGCGKDATAVFNKRANGTPHSEDARALLPQFEIGTLKQ